MHSTGLLLALVGLWMSRLVHRPQVGWLAFPLAGAWLEAAQSWQGTLSERPFWLILSGSMAALVVLRAAVRPGLLGRGRQILALALAALWGVALVHPSVQSAVLAPMWCGAWLSLILGSDPLCWSWQRFGLMSVARPLAWLIVALSLGLWQHSGDGFWLVLPLLVCGPVPSLKLGQSLTPCQATLLLRLPLATVNRCLQWIPLEVQRRWFRPDPMRLHLVEPLLETKNAPGYFFALAQELNGRYGLHLRTEMDLARFCVQSPGLAAETLLQWTVEPPSPPAGWTSDNLSNLIKPGRLAQVAHLLLLQKMIRGRPATS